MISWNAVVLVQDIVLAIVINTSATLLGGAEVAFATWYPYTCAAFGTNVLMQLILPMPAFAQRCTAFLKEAPLRPYASIFVENLVFVTGISLTMAFLQAGFANMLSAWMPTYLWLVLIGYATSVVLYVVFATSAKRRQAAAHEN